MGRTGADVTVVLRRAGHVVAAWPLAATGPPDLGLVDHLARLVVAARDLGCSVVVGDPSGDLARLVRLAGLAGVVAVVPSVDAVGEAEHGEQPGVEEVVVPDDPVA